MCTSFLCSVFLISITKLIVVLLCGKVFEVQFNNTHVSLVYSLQPILQQIHFSINFAENECKHQIQCIHSELIHVV